MNDGVCLSERPDLLPKRLSMRRPGEGDVGAIVSIVGDWEVARVPHPYGPADARLFLEHGVSVE